MFSLRNRIHYLKQNISHLKIVGLISVPLKSPRILNKSFQHKIVRCQGDCCCGTSGASGGTGGSKSKHNLKFEPYKAPPFQDHDAKNMGLNRPMSPHLTIYAPTLPAMTSIVQRVTGIIVTFYFIVVPCGSLFLSNGMETYVSMIQSLDLSRPMIFIIKIILGSSFAYHYFNGIRFCMWNAGKWLAMKDVYGTAKQSFVATAVLTLLFALL